MRIGIISDTHGDLLIVKRVMFDIGQVDLWLHAGDYSYDSELLAKTGVKVVAVKGNCDVNSSAKIDEFAAVAGKQIWLTHGHRYHVKHNLEELIWWSERYEADVVVFGHIHTPVISWHNNRLIFNPGSAAYPRYGHPTYGIINIEDGKISPLIVEMK